jgi:diguanylate cyclase (GGDEF)-like protein
MTNNESRQYKINHKLMLHIVKLTICTLVFSLVIRPIFFEIHRYFIWIEIFDLIIAIIFYFIIRTQKFAKWEITIALITAQFLLFPILAISGGVNSQITYFLPLIPIMAALIGGQIESLCIGIFLVVITIVSTYYSEYFIDLSGGVHIQEKSTSRGFWLTITIGFSMFFGRFFLQKYIRLTDQLKEESLQDPLTKLYNRRGLNLNFEQKLITISPYSPLSLILIDIDYFKKINDKYGHDIGDICLIEVAEILKNTLRKNDIIARFGGEEFIIVLPRTSKKEAATIAENIRYTIDQGRFSSFELPLTITLGMTVTVEKNDTILKIIKRADKALYKGKDKGRNRVELSED